MRSAGVRGAVCKYFLVLVVLTVALSMGAFGWSDVSRASSPEKSPTVVLGSGVPSLVLLVPPSLETYVVPPTSLTFPVYAGVSRGGAVGFDRVQCAYLGQGLSG